jgi:hypothetical protein
VSLQTLLIPCGVKQKKEAVYALNFDEKIRKPIYDNPATDEIVAVSVDIQKVCPFVLLTDCNVHELAVLNGNNSLTAPPLLNSLPNSNISIDEKQNFPN